jgi:transposase
MVFQSEDFKKSAVQKYFNRGSRPVREVARELGITVSSIYKWKEHYGTDPGMKTPGKRPQDRSAAEKLRAVIEYENRSVDQQGEFLRHEGLHSENIESWKKSMKAGLEVEGKLSTQERAERSDDKKKIKELERDLHRKDKALAETAALLVLKKKADLIWGTGENE